MKTSKPIEGTAVRFTAKEREFVYGVALKYMKDEERAKDVTQDALLSAYIHRDHFRGDSLFTTWLYRIAATTALMHLRKGRRWERLQSLSSEFDDDRAMPEHEDPRASPEEVSGAAEAVKLAAGRLAAMGDKYSQIFSMRYIEGYSETEIADRLNLQLATVKTRAYRARNAMKNKLEQANALSVLPQAA